MEACVVIPTFWTSSRGRFRDRIINVYDHPTALGAQGTLPECLASLEKVTGLDRVVVIVAATDPSIEGQAEDTVRDILGDFPGLDAMVMGTAELGSLHRRLEQLDFADMIEGVSLTGYGAVRNLGLIVTAILGCQSLVFIDDDQIVNDARFLDRALEGLGQRTAEGTRILAKSGYYVDAHGRYRMDEDEPWFNALWHVPSAYNRALSVVESQARLRKSTLAFGGCMALHSEIVARVSFDPWVVRGEDLDYIINARMHGDEVFLDSEWHVQHRPPDVADEQLFFRQDIYRFIYEHRKLEFAKSQVDLQQVSVDSLMPYPGEFIGNSIGTRAVVTSLLRAIGGKGFSANLGMAKIALSDAAHYARTNCGKYFAFQARWPQMIERIWEDVALKSLFTGERRMDRTAITGRFPVIRED